MNSASALIKSSPRVAALEKKIRVRFLQEKDKVHSLWEQVKARKDLKSVEAYLLRLKTILHEQETKAVRLVRENPGKAMALSAAAGIAAGMIWSRMRRGSAPEIGRKKTCTQNAKKTGK